MRSVRAIVCVAVALALLGAGRPASAVEPLESALPKETVVFVSVRNVPQLLEKARQLPAYKILIEQGLLEKVVPEEPLGKAREIYERFFKPLGELLPGQVAFALLSTETAERFPPLAFLADVGSTEVAFKLYLKETIYPWLEEDGAESEELRIGTAAVTRFAVPDEPEEEIFLTVDEGVFVATTQKEAMEAIVAALAGTGGENLAANEGFSAAQPTLAGADVVAYTNIAAFIEKARREAVEEKVPEKPQDEGEAAGDLEAVQREIEGGGFPSGESEPEEDKDFSYAEWLDLTWARVEAITGLGQKTFRGVGVGISLGPEGIVTTARVSAPGAAGGLLDVLAREAPPLKSVAYMPQDAAGYVAVSLGSLSQMYEDTIAVLKAYEEVRNAWFHPLEMFQEAEGELDELLGMDIEGKLLPAFGGEVALVGWMPEGLTVPPAAALIEIKDAPVVRELVARVLELIEENTEGTVKASSANLGGVEVTSVEGVPGLTPAVAIVGDFLVVATEPSVIERIAGVKAGEPNLASAAGYQRCVASLPGHGTATAYVDVKQVYDFFFPLVERWLLEEPDEEEIAPAVLDLVRSFGTELSGFGVKLMGDKDGITLRFSSPHGGLDLMGLLVGSSFYMFEGGRDTWDEAEPVEIEDDETEEFIEEDAE